MIAGYAIQADVISAWLPGKSQDDVLSCAYKLGNPGNPQPIPQPKHPPLEHDTPPPDRFPNNQGVSRLIPPSIEKRASFMDCFKPLLPLGAVVDALSLRFPMTPKTLCTIVYLRCGTHNPFGGNNLWMLKHLLPAVAKNVNQAHAQWIRQQAWNHSARLGPISKISPSTADLLARLSKTELLILQRLQLWETEREVAQAVGRSPHTIHVHVKSIYRKLMVTSRRQLLTLISEDHMKIPAGLSPAPAGSDRP
jgi:DNA-binding CsgD family transcriptional regulator